MDSSRLIRVVACFVAGLVIAVGSALIYSLAHGLKQPAEVAQATPQAQHLATAKPLSITAHVPKPSAPAVALSQPASIPEVPSRPPRPKRRAKTTISAAKNRPQIRNKSTLEFARHTPEADRPALQEVKPAQASVTAQIPSSQTHEVTLETGIPITIQLTEKLSTEYNNSGDMFRAVLVEPIGVRGFVVAGSGSKVVGRVEYARRARLLGAESELLLTVVEISTNDGQMVAVQTDSCEQAGAHRNARSEMKVRAGVAVGAILRAVSRRVRAAGFSSGLDDNLLLYQAKSGERWSVVLPVGTKLTFHVAAPLLIASN